MKKYLLCCFYIFAAFVLSAQQVVSTAGETGTAEDYEVSWTIGEPVIVTSVLETNILTQGFHQTKLVVTSVDDLVKGDPDVKVYPNPTQSIVVIEFNGSIENHEFVLFDISGRKLHRGKIGSSETRLNFENRATGIYLLRLMSDKNSHIQTFKIIKE